MRVVWHEPSGWFTMPDGTQARDHYAPHAFDRLKGQEAPFRLGGVEHGTATVVDVVVDADGLGATWTVDIPEMLGRPRRGSMPFGWHGEEQDLASAWLAQMRDGREW
jgi:hypothetical protein